MKPTVSRGHNLLAAAVLGAFVLGGVLMLLGLRRSGGEQATDQKVRSAVLHVLNNQVDAWNRGDLEGFMDGYWRSDELTFVSGKDVTRGWQATHDRYRARYQTSRADLGVAHLVAETPSARATAPGGPPLAVLARHMTAFAVEQADLFTPEMGTLHFDDLQVAPRGAHNAEVRGHWALTFRKRPGVGGRFTLLFREEEQGWCIVRDETTTE